MRGSRVAALLAVVLVLGTAACAGPGTSTQPTASQVGASQPATSSSLPDASAKCQDPLGNTASPADDIQLSPDEIAKVRAGNYKAAVLWAGSGIWYEAADKGAAKAFEELGIQRVATADANYDTAKQKTDVETAMALDPDVVLGNPVDPVAAADAFRPVVTKGMGLVLTDVIPQGFTPGKEYSAFVAGNRCQSGAIMADLMAEAIGGSGKIGMIFYDADFFATNILDSNFKKVIQEKYPDIEIAAEQGFATEAGTQGVAEAMLAQHPDLKGIYVSWSVAAQGVIAALRAAGSDIKVVTHDLDAVNDVDMAKGRNLYGVAAEHVYDIGYRMGMAAGYSLLGKELPPFNTVQMMKVTKDNLVDAWNVVYNTDPPDAVKQALQP